MSAFPLINQSHKIIADQESAVGGRGAPFRSQAPGCCRDDGDGTRVLEFREVTEGLFKPSGAAVIRSLRNDGRKWCPVDQIEYWDKCCRWRDGAERAPVHFGESGVGDQTGEFQGNGVISSWRNVNKNKLWFKIEYGMPV